MSTPPATSTPFDIARYPFVGTLVTAAWTFLNRVISDLPPLWAFVFGAMGSLLLAALSPNLSSTEYPERWRRVVIYVGLGIFNAIVLASASIGGEEAVDQGLDDAADDGQSSDETS